MISASDYPPGYPKPVSTQLPTWADAQAAEAASAAVIAAWAGVIVTLIAAVFAYRAYRVQASALSDERSWRRVDEHQRQLLEARKVIFKSLSRSFKTSDVQGGTAEVEFEIVNGSGAPLDAVVLEFPTVVIPLQDQSVRWIIQQNEGSDACYLTYTGRVAVGEILKLGVAPQPMTPDDIGAFMLVLSPTMYWSDGPEWRWKARPDGYGVERV